MNNEINNSDNEELEKSNVTNSPFLVAKEYINTSIDVEIVALANHLSEAPIIDVKGIRNKYQRNMFKEYMTQIEKLATLLIAFVSQLKYDDEELYKKLLKSQLDTKTIQEKLKSCKSEKDLQNFKCNPFTPEEIEKLNEIAENWFDKQEFEKALLYLTFLLTLDPTNRDMWYYKGMAEQYMSKYQEALQSFYVVLEIDSRFLLAYFQIVNCLILNNQLEDAKQCYKHLMDELDPEEYSHNELYMSKMELLKKYLQEAA